SPAYTDSNWQVQDGIPIRSIDLFTLTSQSSVAVSATQDGGTVTTAGSINVCASDGLYQFPVLFPFTGTSVDCHYVIPLPDGTPGTVTATATFSDNSQAS